MARGNPNPSPETRIGAPRGPKPGRLKASRNKVGQAFLEDLQEVWARDGKAALRKAVKEDPMSFARMVASLVPKELTVTHDNVADLTDEEIDILLHLIRAAGGNRDSSEERAPTTH